MITDNPTIINGAVSVDDRGSVRFVNDFDFSGVKRFYQVQNHRRGFIRAWHGHKIEGKYVYVVRGAAYVAAVPIGTLKEKVEDAKSFVLSSEVPKVLWIPPGYYNGFMNLEEDTIIQFFSTSTLEQSKGDDIRLPHDHWDIWTESCYR